MLQLVRKLIKQFHELHIFFLIFFLLHEPLIRALSGLPG